jgi:hypothetical protein
VIIDVGTAVQPQENGQENESDKAAASDGNDSDKYGGGFEHIQDDEIDPIICVHCDAVNKGTALYCSSASCGKVLT